MNFPIHFAALLLALLPFAAHGQSVTLNSCNQGKSKAIKDCDDKITWESSNESNKNAIAQGQCMKGYSTPGCAAKASELGSSAGAANDRAAQQCRQSKEDCTKKCDSSKAVYKDEKPKIDQAKKECHQEIDKKLAKLAAERPGADDTKKDGEDQKDASKDKDKPANTPQGGAPPTPPKSEDEAKKDEPTPPAQPAAAAPAAPQQEKDKEGKAGIDDKAKEQSAAGPCTGAKFMCGGCPGFLQKCPGGNPTTCMAKWSDADRKNYDANCGGSSTPATQALTNPSTPQSLGGAAPMSAGGGGAGSTVSGGANTAAMLDDGKKNDKEERGGHKEGGSMGVESAGGGGGGGGDSFSSNPFGDDSSSHSGLSALAGMKTMSSSLANAFSASQNATSGVLDRTGPNLFSIQEAAFAERCKRNLLYHCPNRK